MHTIENCVLPTSGVDSNMDLFKDLVCGPVESSSCKEPRIEHG